MKIKINRRNFFKLSGAGLASAYGVLHSPLSHAAPYRVIVIGGGFAGATAAKYLKLWGGGSVEVTMIDPKTVYYSPILSNLILNGNMQLSQLAFTYASLESKYQVRHRANSVVAINGQAKQVTLNDGTTLSYDRLIVAPGIEFKFVNQYDVNAVPHAYMGGAQAELLRDQIRAMPAGGTFVMTIPPSPFRCPPGPYERACVVADWLNRNKPGSKVIVLDANPDIVVEKDSFGARFQQYGVQYYPGVSVTAVDSATKTVSVSGAPAAQYRADVLNVIPPQRAGSYAMLQQAGLVSGDWCPVDAKTFESRLVPGIHIIGDAQGTSVPKAGHIGNSEAKVCAEAVLNLLHGYPPFANPKINSACYSPVSANEATWLTAVFQYDPAANDWRAIAESKGAGAPTTWHYREMFGWTNNLFTDTFA